MNCLNNNEISDISPLLHIPGLTSGYGKHVYLRNNPLSDNSVHVYLPELKALNPHLRIDYTETQKN
jgi:hypothetical protein